MGKQDTQNVVVAKNSGIVVREGKSSARTKLHLKLWAIICGVVLLCIVAGSVVWQITRKNDTKTQSQQVSTSQSSKKANVNTLNSEEKYHYLASTGNYAGAEQALGARLATASDTTSRLTIYSQQSAVALQFKQYDDAKGYADKALQLDPNSDIPYVTLAYWAESQGNSQGATSYWQQAIEKLDINAPQYELLKQQYQSNIQRLK